MSGDGLRDLVDSPCQLQIAEERIAKLEFVNEASRNHTANIEAENAKLRELVQHIKSAADLSDSHGLPLLEDLDVAICSAMRFVESPKRAEEE